jgi:hypothetical protein
MSGSRDSGEVADARVAEDRGRPERLDDDEVLALLSMVESSAAHVRPDDRPLVVDDDQLRSLLTEVQGRRDGDERLLASWRAVFDLLDHDRARPELGDARGGAAGDGLTWALAWTRRRADLVRRVEDRLREAGARRTDEPCAAERSVRP